MGTGSLWPVLFLWIVINGVFTSLAHTDTLMESTTTTPTESDIMIKTNELAPTDMEACLMSRIEDLEQEVRVQRLEALAAAIQAAADMIKPMVTTGSVSITIRTSELAEKYNDTVSAIFQGMAPVFLTAGAEAGPWYGDPSQRAVTLKLPSGQTLTAIQTSFEVTGAE